MQQQRHRQRVVGPVPQPGDGSPATASVGDVASQSTSQPAAAPRSPASSSLEARRTGRVPVANRDSVIPASSAATARSPRRRCAGQAHQVGGPERGGELDRDARHHRAEEPERAAERTRAPPALAAPPRAAERPRRAGSAARGARRRGGEERHGHRGPPAEPGADRQPEGERGEQADGGRVGVALRDRRRTGRPVVRHQRGLGRGEGEVAADRGQRAGREGRRERGADQQQRDAERDQRQARRTDAAGRGRTTRSLTSPVATVPTAMAVPCRPATPREMPCSTARSGTVGEKAYRNQPQVTNVA